MKTAEAWAAELLPTGHEYEPSYFREDVAAALQGLMDENERLTGALKDMRDAAIYQCAAHADKGLRDEAYNKIVAALDRTRAVLNPRRRMARMNRYSPEFETWHASMFPGENGSGKEYAWQGWLAARSLPVNVTDEMVERGARGLAAETDRRWEIAARACGQPFIAGSPDRALDPEELMDVRACLTAALETSDAA